MAKIHNVGVELRESSRRELKAQVDRFVAQGGTIQQVPTAGGSVKPVAKAWSSTRAQSFEYG